MDYKKIFRKLERNLDRLERADHARDTLSAILPRLVDDFHDDLGLTGGRIYVREGDHFELCNEYPASENHVGFRIPISYAPVRELAREGYVLYEPADPKLDADIEGALGVRTFAAICVGEARELVVAFSLADSSNHEHVIYVLNTIRHVINLKLRKEHLEDRLAEARTIQLSLLPSRAPEFPGFDIWGASVPAEEVGGDLFDFLHVSDRTLGIAVADAAGHGLPAALQGRDAIIGLRMGVEERMRITATIEKLNKVIGHSALASRFISLFYCEIESNGTTAYCNAGHNPPLLFHEGCFTELTEGGLVLGPNPQARYQRGYVRMRPGAVLLAYTDGIVEAESSAGEMFGVDRLRSIVSERGDASARQLVEAVFDGVRAFSAADPPIDDQTVVAAVRS